MLVSPSVSFVGYDNLRCYNFSPEEGILLAIPSDKTLLRTKLYRVATVLTDAPLHKVSMKTRRSSNLKGAIGCNFSEIVAVKLYIQRFQAVNGQELHNEFKNSTTFHKI